MKTLMGAKILEVKYDDVPSRYLAMALIGEIDKGGVPVKCSKKWVNITYEGYESSTLMDTILLKNKDVYPAVLKFCEEMIDSDDIVQMLYNESATLKGGEVCFSRPPYYKNAHDMAAQIMVSRINTEILDEYLYHQGPLSCTFFDRGETKQTILFTSDNLEKFLSSASLTFIDNIELPMSDLGHIPNYRYVVERDNYYVLKKPAGYLLSESSMGCRFTRVYSRAMKFLSEDEAIHYALNHAKGDSADDEFEIKRIDYWAYVSRMMPIKTLRMKEINGTAIEDSFPFLSIYTEDEERA